MFGQFPCSCQLNATTHSGEALNVIRMKIFANVRDQLIWQSGECRHDMRKEATGYLEFCPHVKGYGRRMNNPSSKAENKCFRCQGEETIQVQDPENDCYGGKER